MAAKLLNLTDPHRPKWHKWSDIRLCESRIEWLEPNKTFRFKPETPRLSPNRFTIPSVRVLEAPTGKVSIEPNIDRMLGVKFQDPAKRALAKTPQLNSIWMGEKVWLACD